MLFFILSSQFIPIKPHVLKQKPVDPIRATGWRNAPSAGKEETAVDSGHVVT